ncbi:MAG: sigma-54 dependent transcriptional regulator [candidate division WOR-3 bacterium]|nr:sigma-54 dependent transcriptional regulator [candidate division WOR-3 bacterium]
MNRPSILLVEDNISFRLFLREALSEFADIDETGTVKEAESGLQSYHDIVILDIKLPDGSGLDLIESVRKLHPGSRIIMLTGHGDIPTAIDAVKRGASDFWTKPIEYTELVRKIHRIIHGLQRRENIDDIIAGNSENMSRVRMQIKDTADTDVNVMIRGEPGTGRELTARTIHSLSSRDKFTIIDFATLTDSLFESELFGCVRGAYSGADRARKGRIEGSEGGTVLLTGLESINLEKQAKILRFIDRKEIMPVGSGKTKLIDVRIISSLNENIEGLVESNQFRKDLYYRLNVYPIFIEPLRERREDIIPIAGNVLNKLNASLPDWLLDKLKYYDWPGNVRELQNILKRYALTGNSGIIESLQERDTGISGLKEKVTRIKSRTEREEIVKTLKITDGNKTKAAKILKISYRSLLDKIKEYNIE